jgi:ribonuclease HI
MLKPRLKIYFDGGCQPNPGEMEAAVVVRGITHHWPNLGHGTNNDAEWLALIHALRIARDLGEPDFELLGDSAVVVNQATGAQKCRSGALQRHRAAFAGLAAECGAIRIKRIGRSQNLAGIALDRIADARRTAAGKLPFASQDAARLEGFDGRREP